MIGRLRLPSGKAPFLAAAILLFLVNFAVRYPATLTPDSRSQLEQAVSGHFTDWHPPIMAALWSNLSPQITGPTSMLAIHLAALWIGLACVGDGLRRTGSPAMGLAVLASGLSPVILYYSGIILKDVGVASMCIAAFGGIFWFRIQERRISLWAAALVVAALSYATLVRANAIFATPPLLVYALGGNIRLRYMLPISAALAIAMIPASSVVNRALAPDGQTGVRQSIQLYDLAGIAYHSGNLSVLPTPVTHLQLGRCYTPLFWDTLGEEICGRAWQKLPPPGSPEREAIADLWLKSIAAHPVAYAEHRLRHFNASLQFLVPAAQHCRLFPAMHDCGQVHLRADGKGFAFSDRVRVMDYIKKNPLVWPIAWLVLGLGLFAGALALPSSPRVYAGLTLSLSGLLYGLGYAVVGVAADPRYYLWTILAVQTSALLLMPIAMRSNPRSLRITASALIVVLILGYAFRIGDIGALVDIS